MSDTDKPATQAPIDDLAVWLTAYQEATVNAAKWKETAERARSEVTARLDAAGADVGLVEGKPAVRWTPIVSKRFDSRRFRAENPTLAEAYVVETESRRFTVVGD